MAENDEYGTLGERLRTLRHKARLTQAKLAENADISCVYVNKLERGLAVPSLQVLNRLAKSLNTDAASLLATESTAADAQSGQATQSGRKKKQSQPRVLQPSPYMALYLAGAKSSMRNLVFQTTETPLPPLPSAVRKPQK
jgi:transcriptional regulator with XRE-family HTH domain